jgi:hypothetical protein
MTVEQPPSVEALAILKRHDDRHYTDEDTNLSAHEIDALCEQRVSAETERIYRRISLFAEGAKLGGHEERARAAEQILVGLKARNTAW